MSVECPQPQRVAFVKTIIYPKVPTIIHVPEVEPEEVTEDAGFTLNKSLVNPEGVDYFPGSILFSPTASEEENRKDTGQNQKEESASDEKTQITEKETSKKKNWKHHDPNRPRRGSDSWAQMQREGAAKDRWK